MKKTWRALLVLILALSLAMVLSSCGDKDKGNDDEGKDEGETKITYTVTVVDDNGAPVKGITVELTAGSGTPVPFTTDSEGKITYKSSKTVEAKVTKIPASHYFGNLNKALEFDKDGNLNITLEAYDPYVIKVVDDEGNPISGIKVQMCDESGSCRLPKTTDANGEASYPYEEGTFHAQLTVPEGKTVEDLYPGYTVEDSAAYYDFDGSYVTIVLTKIAD